MTTLRYNLGCNNQTTWLMLYRLSKLPLDNEQRKNTDLTTECIELKI